MTRPLRRWHARIWLILGPLLLAGFVGALLARPPAPIEQTRQAEAAP